MFGQISSSNRLAFVEHLQLAGLSAGQVLIRAGEDPDRMFLLASGTAEITVAGAAGPRVIHRISPGETLGAIGLITDSPHKAAATALTEMTAYRLDKNGLLKLLDRQPDLRQIMEDVARRVRATGHPKAVVAGQSNTSKREMFRDRLHAFLQALEIWTRPYDRYLSSSGIISACQLI